MTQVVSQGSATDGASLADVTPAVGVRWLPHPDYVGEFVVGTNTIKGATANQEALYYAHGTATASSAPDWSAQAKVNAVAAGAALSGALGFAYNIDLSKFKTFYLARFASATLFELLKIDSGGTSTLGTATYTNTLTSTTDQWTFEVHNANGVHNVFWGFIGTQGTATSTQNYTLVATDTSPLGSGKFGIYANGSTTQGFVVASTNITAGFVDTGTTANLSSFTLLSDSIVQPGGEGLIPALGSLTVTGTGIVAPDVAISIAALQASGSDVGGAIALQPLTVAGEAWTTGFGDTATIPLWTSTATARQGIGGSASAFLPRLTSAIAGHFTQNKQDLQSLTIDGTGSQSIVGTANARLPLFQSQAQAEEKGAGFAALSVGGLTVAGSGLTTIVGTGGGTIRLLAASIQAAVGVGSFGSAALGSLLAEGTGFVSIMGLGVAALPRLHAEARAVLGDSAVARIVAMNAENGAVTEFEGWDFNSFLTLSGTVYGATAAGIVALGGDQDSTTKIAAYLETGEVDFGTDYLKRATDAYAAYKTPGSMVLSVTGKVGKRNETYDYDLPEGEDETEPRKADLGRGFESRYFVYRLANRAGADFSIDALTVLAQVTGRRG